MYLLLLGECFRTPKNKKDQKQVIANITNSQTDSQSVEWTDAKHTASNNKWALLTTENTRDKNNRRKSQNIF